MSPLRLAVAGAGANVWTVMHAPAVDAVGAEVVAVFDPRREAAERVAAERGCAAAADLEALLAHPADAVVILAPHLHHPELAIRCLEAGRHVLVEKPIAVTIGEADRMVAAADRAGCLLAVALQQRTRHEVVAARRLLAEGALGDLQRVDLLACWPRRSSYFAGAPWRGTWAGEGGGIVINQGQHDLDLLCWLAGRPDAVVARTSSAMHGLEVEDTAVALLEWSQGATGTLRVTTAEAGEPQRLEIAGTRGRLRLTPGRLEVWRSAQDFRDYAAAGGDPYDAPEAGPPEVTGGGGGGHADLYRNLETALRGRQPLVAPGRQAAAAVELANALVMSAHRRTAVSLPLDRAASTRLLEALREPLAAATKIETDGGGGA